MHQVQSDVKFIQKRCICQHNYERTLVHDYCNCIIWQSGSLNYISTHVRLTKSQYIM